MPSHLEEQTDKAVLCCLGTFFSFLKVSALFIECKKSFSLGVQDHTDTRRLDFLPHHFLLTSVGAQGVLRYQVSWPVPARCVKPHQQAQRAMHGV